MILISVLYAYLPGVKEPQQQESEEGQRLTGGRAGFQTQVGHEQSQLISWTSLQTKTSAHRKMLQSR